MSSPPRRVGAQYHRSTTNNSQTEDDMGRMVKRLSNLVIDEVSLVDRPANQYGTVEITKAYQEDNMSVFDAAGDEVFEDELESGQFVYDEEGNEFVVDDSQGGDDDAEELDYELQSVGKAGRGAQTVVRRTWGTAMQGRALQAGDQAQRLAKNPKATARLANQKLGAPAANWATRGDAIGPRRQLDSRSRDAAAHVGRNALAYTGGGTALVGTGGAYGVSRARKGNASKSYGQGVLEDLSKALSDEDRDYVIAKAMDDMAQVADRNAELEDAVSDLYAEREFEGYADVAKSYGFGDEDEIAGILYRASQFMPQQDVAALDRYFSASGEIAKSYFQEIGYGNGYEASDVMGQVYEYAGQAVSKNAELGLTQEQAVSAMFSANPSAYDEYEAEQRLR